LLENTFDRKRISSNPNPNSNTIPNHKPNSNLNPNLKAQKRFLTDKMLFFEKV